MKKEKGGREEKKSSGISRFTYYVFYVQGSIDRCIIHKKEIGALRYSDHIHGIEFGVGVE